MKKERHDEVVMPLLDGNCLVNWVNTLVTGHYLSKCLILTRRQQRQNTLLRYCMKR